uniref:tRNA-dihydrouridine(16/17) synthase [NAD(P)(+)] n=1 Tax=Hirondellea gigas TaxID=1518452 RepID=A0A2P2I7C8_9CRUS
MSEENDTITLAGAAAAAGRNVPDQTPENYMDTSIYKTSSSEQNIPSVKVVHTDMHVTRSENIADVTENTSCSDSYITFSDDPSSEAEHPDSVSNGTSQSPVSSGKATSQDSDKCSEQHPGWRFWRETLGGARLVVAPMVDASELAWRLLSRRYGAELCYTPMLHSAVLVRDPRYRRDSLQSCQEDRPLIAQLCGNDPSIVGEACRLMSPHCDGIDINLGCPQAIARKGRYGAFLMDDWPLIAQLVRSAVANSSVPVTCKIRVFEDKQRTVEYALMLQDAGAALLTVHGRTREQKGPLTGLADWSYVTAVRKAVRVPVFANGNIQYLSDVHRCLQETGVQGVMTAEGNLHNPALFAADSAHPPNPARFTGPAPTVWQMALEYLELALEYPCPISYSRGHIFKILHHCFGMSSNSDVRQTISRSNTVAEMMTAVQTLRERMLPYSTGQQTWTPENEELAKLRLSPWLCQPYVRVSPAVHVLRCEKGQLKAARERRVAELQRHVAAAAGIPMKRPLEQHDLCQKEADLLLQHGEMCHLSKKKAKKLLRNPKKKFPGPAVENLILCICRSPRGGRCEYELCKACCKSKCYRDNLDCTGHRIWVKTNRRKAVAQSPTLDSTTPSTAGETAAPSTAVEAATQSPAVESTTSSLPVDTEQKTLSAPKVPGRLTTTIHEQSISSIDQGNAAALVPSSDHDKLALCCTSDTYSRDLKSASLVQSIDQLLRGSDDDVGSSVLEGLGNSLNSNVAELLVGLRDERVDNSSSCS